MYQSGSPPDIEGGGQDIRGPLYQRGIGIFPFACVIGVLDAVAGEMAVAVVAVFLDFLLIAPYRHRTVQFRLIHAVLFDPAIGFKHPLPRGENAKKTFRERRKNETVTVLRARGHVQLGADGVDA